MYTNIEHNDTALRDITKLLHQLWSEKHNIISDNAIFFKLKHLVIFFLCSELRSRRALCRYTGCTAHALAWLSVDIQLIVY